MKILAIESTAAAASAAITEDGKICAEFFSDTNQKHSRTLMVMVEALLKCTGISLGDIDALAVSNGPGSFTGVRIGVSCIKGMAMPFDKTCIGISSLLTAAYPLKKSGKLICAVIDARCNRVYNAFFKSNGEELERLTEDRIVDIDDLSAQCAKFGSEAIFIGDGAKICRDKLNNIITADELCICQRASSTALAAETELKNGHGCQARELVPIYLSVPQAQRTLIVN